MELLSWTVLGISRVTELRVMPKSLMFSELEGRIFLWEGRLCSGVDRYGFIGLVIDHFADVRFPLDL